MDTGPMPPMPKGLFGSDLYRDIEVSPEWTLTNTDAARELLKLRREIVDRVHLVQLCQGQGKRHRGEAVALAGQLESAKEMSPAQKMDIEGRLEIAQAQAQYCDAKIEQAKMELRACRALIEGVG